MTQSPSPNSTISHYRILSKIGEGGMGEVYLAEDIKLDRKVALKILPPEFAKDKERMNRFVREAKSASALNHPNILTIYEIDETQSGYFIATEFIVGETLRERARRVPITLGEAIDIATQTASALAAAHQAGIIHRDIKPENVMVRDDGLVKVLDFGLAKLTAGGVSDPESETRLHSGTQPGMIMGTVAYMSPQQARGQLVDRRTDVWSLGVVLYELLSGRQPFRGETPTDTLANILQREPEPLNIAALPPDLAQIVGKMLAKNLEARYSTVTDVLSDLKSLKKRIEFEAQLRRTPLPDLRTEAQTQMIPSSERLSEMPIDSGAARAEEGFWVAVLPFKHRGGSSDLEALAESLAEEIVTGLSRFSYLKVIARSSTLGFTESTDIRSVGKQLGARYVMEGSLRQAGLMLRVTVQLVDTSTGAHIWAETYNRTFSPESVFELQDDLVPRIVSTVADRYGALVHSMSESVRGRSAGQYSPHEAVLRGFAYHERVTPQEHAEVRAILEAAVAEAPSHSNCNAMLASLYWNEFSNGYNARPDPLGRALAVAQQAVASAPANNIAHYSLACVLFFKKDFSAFRPAAERAIALNPMDASSTAFLGILLSYSGDWEYGLGVTERAMRLNPHHPGWYYFGAFYNAYRQRDYHGALEVALKVNMLGSWHTYASLAATYGQLGELERARAALRELLALAPDYGSHVRELLGHWFDTEMVEHLIDGLRKAGLQVVETERSITQSSGSQSATHRTGSAKMRTGMVNHPFLNKFDPLLENIRHEERFKSLMSEAKQLSEQISGTASDGGFDKGLDRSSTPNHEELKGTIHNSVRDTIPTNASSIKIETPTGESSQARTAELKSSELSDLSVQNEAVKLSSAGATIAKSSIRDSKSTWWLLPLLGFLVLLGGFFAYPYFTTSSKQIESIAVMPFVNEGGNKDVEYLSDGMTETLISSLSQLPNLSVKPRSSVFRYKGKDTNPQTIAKELNVQAILNGRVVQRGPDLSLYVELMDIALDKVVWSQQYNRKQTELVTLQSDIARDVSSRLKTKLSGADEAKVTKIYTTNPEAYQLYLKGNYYHSKYNEEGLKKGLEQYQKAIELDPNYALAYYGIGVAYNTASDWYLQPREAGPKAKAATLKALELDDTLAEAHKLLGVIAFWYDWDWITAEREMKRATELDSSYTIYGPYLSGMGRVEEAIIMQQKAVQQFPLDLLFNYDLEGAYLYARRFDEAMAQGRKTLEIDPHYWASYQTIGLVYEAKKQYTDAIAALEKARSLDNNPSILGYLGYVYAAAGKKDDALRLIDELKELSKQRHVPPYSIAIIYAGLNDKDQAFEWLNKAYDQRSFFITLLKVETVLDNLRPDPRFKELVKRVNLPE